MTMSGLSKTSLKCLTIKQQSTKFGILCLKIDKFAIYKHLQEVIYLMYKKSYICQVKEQGNLNLKL